MNEQIKNIKKYIKLSPDFYMIGGVVLFFMALMSFYGPVLSEDFVANIIGWALSGVVPFFIIYAYGHKAMNNGGMTLYKYVAQYIMGLSSLILILSLFIGANVFTAFFDIVIIYTIVFLPSTSIGIVLLNVYLDKNKNKVQQPCVLKNIPINKRGFLYSLHAEDHYVRIITSKSNSLVYGKFSEFVKQTDLLEGVLIHRSHWISINGFEKITTEQGKIMCHLKNGDILPVSRGGLKLLKDNNWIK